MVGEYPKKYWWLVLIAVPITVALVPLITSFLTRTGESSGTTSVDISSPILSKSEVGSNLLDNTIFDPYSVAIIYLDSRKIEQDVYRIDFPRYFESKLIQLNRFEVIGQEVVAAGLEELSLGEPIELVSYEIGRMLGVDYVITGSISQLRTDLILEIRIIDAQENKIFKNYSIHGDGTSVQPIDQMFTQICEAINDDFPILKGSVIKVEDNKVFIDLGQNHGIRVGTQLLVYREDVPEVDPVIGETVGKNIRRISFIVVDKVFNSYSTAASLWDIATKAVIGDKVISR